MSFDTPDMKELLEDIQEYYPGSRTPIIRHLNSVSSSPEIRAQEDWDQDPLLKRKYSVKGIDTEFFTLGALARALGRSQATIRGWETNRVIPSPSFKKKGQDSRGTRRLYTRAQIEGLRKIAEEEGLFNNDFRPLKKTNFTQRAFALFQELKEAGS